MATNDSITKCSLTTARSSESGSHEKYRLGSYVIVGEHAVVDDAAVLAEVEDTTGREHRSHPGEDRGQVLSGHVQQAVHGEHRVELAVEAEVEEVTLVGDESLGAAVLDHRGRQVGAHDLEAGVGEEPAVHARAGADLQQGAAFFASEELEECAARRHLPGFERRARPALDGPVVGAPELSGYLFVAVAHTDASACSARRRAMTRRQSVSSAPSKIDSTRASTKKRDTGNSSA